MLTLHSSNLSTVGKRSRLSSEACRASVASRGRLAARDRMLVAQAQPLRVAIVGGGICGPTLAALMARELRDPSVLAGGVDVHLFEQRDDSEDRVGPWWTGRTMSWKHSTFQLVPYPWQF